MDWIKRNLLFVVGSAAALVLMGLASYYLLSGSRKNGAALEQLNAEYALLKQLSDQKPHPGDDKIDNISAARKQKSEVARTMSKLSTVFQPVASIPSAARLDSAMFAGALRKTIDQMQAEATKGGVQLPTNFSFSFTAFRERIMFDQAGLKPLAAQLGEVKAICDVLIHARVNALDSVRREKVSVHDAEAQQSADYLSEPATTNQIAILAPYEVSFRCFSPELAAVLGGFASSPHGLIVRAMNVEPASVAGPLMGGTEGGYAVPAPAPTTPWVDPYEAARRRAYGQPGAPPAVNPQTTPSAGRGGLPTMLDEKQIKVTLLVQVVKLASKK